MWVNIFVKLYIAWIKLDVSWVTAFQKSEFLLQ